jgi:hypothetical protein
MRSLKWLTGLSLSFFIMLSTSCMKDCWNKQMQTKQASFTFKAGDSIYVWNGDYTDGHPYGARSTIGSSSGQQLFTIYAKGFNGNALEITLYTSKFQQGQYTNTAGIQSLEFTGLLLQDNWNFDLQRDLSTLNITSVDQNQADGTFEGTMTQGNNKEQLQISQGEFHNVKIQNN